jgi:hypothetical protein
MLNAAPKLTPAELVQLATRPTTAVGLLRLLGMQHDCVMRQRVALSEWLNCNTATAELRLSLRANGYGLLLPRPQQRKFAPVNVAPEARAS